MEQIPRPGHPTGTRTGSNRELLVHIVTGQPTPIDGVSYLENDAMLSYEDPHEFGGEANLFEGQDAGAIDAANHEQATGLGFGLTDGAAFNLEQFNQNDDHGPDSGGPNVSKYGPMNVGKE